MNRNVKISAVLLIASVVCLVSAVAYSNSLINQLNQQPTQINVYEKSGLIGHVVVKVNGEVWCEMDNVVTDIGEKRVRNFLGWANQSDGTNITKYIALSPSSSPGATGTKLTSEYTDSGLTRAAGTVTFHNATSYQVEHEFTCSADSKTVTSTAVHWLTTSDSDNNMYCCADLSNPPTLDTDDTITITWTLQSVSG